MNKRGAIEDVIFIVISLFMLSIVFLIGVYLANTFSTSVQPTFTALSANSTIAFSKVNDIANTTFNYLYLAVFITLLIALIITAFMTPTHPIFFAFFIILSIVLVVMAVILSNVYESITAASVFVTPASHLTIPAAIMGNLPLITVAIAILLAVIIFSRASNPYGEGAATR